jgi:hypothetical protein
MVTFGSLLSLWLTTFPMHHAFWKKGTKHFFVNILQKVNKNISNNIFFSNFFVLLNITKIEISNVIL